MSKIKILYALGDLGKDSIHIVGGKAAHLGELIRKGIPIPEGFVLSTSAFERFLNHSPFVKEIREILDQEISLTEIMSISQTINDYIMQTEIISELKDVIIDRFSGLQRLDPEKLNVAVRSSANVEDLSQTSFAGQADTFLCISSVEELLDSIKKCWASLFSARALMYIQQMLMKKKLRKKFQKKWNLLITTPKSIQISSNVSGLFFKI